jgi:hypothetical protein
MNNEFNLMIGVHEHLMLQANDECHLRLLLEDRGKWFMARGARN